MVNYAIYYGASLHFDEYRLRILKAMPRDWNLFLVAKKKHDLSLGVKYAPVGLYDHPVFKRKLAKEEILEQERWLGRPFRWVLESNYYWRPDKLRNIGRYSEYLAKFTIAWRDFFTKNRIDVFTTTLESGFLENIGQLVSVRLGITNININTAPMSNTFHLLDENFKPRFWKGLSAKEKKDYYGKFESYYLKRTKPINPINAEKLSKSVITPANVLRKIRTFTDYVGFYSRLPEIERIKYQEPEHFFALSIKKNVRYRLGTMLYDKPKENEKFFIFTMYYPLEAKNSYMEFFNNPYRIISEIARVLPLGCYLYIKPHPYFGCSYVPVNELLKLKRYKNVRLLHHRENTYELLKKSLGLIHVSSTTGFEAIALGKPVITFGHSYTADQGTSIVIRDYQLLPEAIMKVIENPEWGIDKNERMEFLANEYKHLIPVEGTVYHKQITDNDGAKIAGQIVECYEALKRKGRGQKPRTR